MADTHRPDSGENLLRPTVPDGLCLVDPDRTEVRFGLLSARGSLPVSGGEPRTEADHPHGIGISTAARIATGVRARDRYLSRAHDLVTRSIEDRPRSRAEATPDRTPFTMVELLPGVSHLVQAGGTPMARHDAR